MEQKEVKRELDKPIAGWADRMMELINRLGVKKGIYTLFFSTILITFFFVLLLAFLFLPNISMIPFILICSLFCFPVGFFCYAVLYISNRLMMSRIEVSGLGYNERSLHQNFMENIRRLNWEIEERKRAFNQKRQAIEELRYEIKARKKSQQDFEETTNLLRSIVDSSPDIFYYRDVNGRFAGVNKMFVEVTGKSQQELLGRYVSEIYSHNEVPASILIEHEIAPDENEITYDAQYNMPNGDVRWFEMRTVPFYDTSGLFIGTLGFGRDITARKQAERELEKSYQDKGKFIATLSHELRTPLNGITGLVRMLLDSDLDKTQRSWTNTIYTSAETLGNIFNDIIDLDKVDRHQLDIVPETVYLIDFVNDLVNFGSLICEQKNLSFKYKTQGILEAYISIDTTRVRQVIWNLINNAVKFTKKGGVTLLIERQLVDDKNTLNFQVKDTGIGISITDIKHIFDMYYKVPEGRRINALGSGIGLAVSKSLIEAMAGDISVVSEVDIGSNFIVSIPTEEVAPSEEQKYEGRQLNVLLIEDVPLNAQIARNLFEQRGHEIIWAEDGAEALALLETEDDIDLILLDMQLPDMTGDELARIIRDTEEWQNYIIFVVTANVRKAVEQLEEIEIQGTLGKPINTKQLDDLLNKYFGQISNRIFEQSTIKIENTMPEIIDTHLVNDLANSLGLKQFISSIGLFEKLFPGYVNDLVECINEQALEKFQSGAHKLKGAASSIGLVRIQKQAFVYECLEQANWEELIIAMDEFKINIEEDVEQLKNIIAQE